MRSLHILTSPRGNTITYRLRLDGSVAGPGSIARTVIVTAVPLGPLCSDRGVELVGQRLDDTCAKADMCGLSVHFLTSLIHCPKPRTCHLQNSEPGILMSISPAAPLGNPCFNALITSSVTINPNNLPLRWRSPRRSSLAP